MCGRFTLTTPGEELAETLGLASLAEHSPQYNIAPGQRIAAVRAAGTGPEAAALKWGLVPGWSKEPRSGYRMINARAETITEKPAFRTAVRRRRCLILADGYYEWQKTGSGKQPWYITLPGHALFTFAGIWESWQQGDSDTLETCAIVTRAANPALAPIHDRMPVLIAAADRARWLEAPLEADDIKTMLLESANDSFETVAVSTRVNSPRNDDADCIAPLPAAAG